jgi:hypothetical protein
LTRASQENAFFRASSGEIARFFVISATEVAHLRHLRSGEMTKKEEKKRKKEEKQNAVQQLDDIRTGGKQRRTRVT